MSVHIQAQSGVEYASRPGVCAMSTRTQRHVVGEREADEEKERERALQAGSGCSMISPADVIPFSQQRYS